MKNIFKLLFASLLVTMVFVACDNDADRDWTTPEASFTLYDTSLGSNILYETMKDNPFILTWEKTGSSESTVVFSSTEDFSNKKTLGTSDTNTFKTTIGNFNTKLLQAGYSPYAAQTVYVRVETATEVSNAISFTVTVYPTDGPIITAPTTGSSFVLNAVNADDTATTVAWNDYSKYGVDVKYTVEIALAGSTTYSTIGEVTVPNPNSSNVTNTLSLTTKALNTAILNLGAVIAQSNNIDFMVTASTVSTGGSIVLSSEVATVKVTPYSVDIVTLYLIGDATAGEWNNSLSNADMYPLLGNHNVSTSYTYTGYFKTGGFKIIKEKGSWNDQYGAGSTAGSLSTDGGSGNINVTTAGYYKLTINTGSLTYTLEPVTPSSTTYPTVGIIGDATPNSWNSSTAMTKSAFDPHVWYITNVTLTAGELKFRANNSWDVNWGSGDEDFGTATSGGSNIPVKAGTYNIYFNDYSGDYVLIKL